MNRILKISMYVMLLISAILTVYFYLNAPASVGSMTDAESTALDIYLNWAYLLLGISVVAAVALPVINMLTNPESLKRNIVKIALVIVVCLAAYFIAPGTEVPVSASVTASAADFKMTDVMLYLTYFLTAVAVLAIVIGGIVNIIRNR